MNTLGATRPGLRPPGDAAGPRQSGAEAADALGDAFGAVLGALAGGRNPEEATTPEADRPARRREDEAGAESVAASGEETGPMALLALVVPTAPVGMPASRPQAISLEALVARALPAPAPVPPGAAGAGAAVSEPAAAGSEPVGVDPMAGLDPVLAGLVPQPSAAASPEARTRVAVLQRETHFAPVLPRLLAWAAGPRESTSPPVASSAPVASTPGSPDPSPLFPVTAEIRPAGAPVPGLGGRSAPAGPGSAPVVPTPAASPRATDSIWPPAASPAAPAAGSFGEPGAATEAMPRAGLTRPTAMPAPAPVSPALPPQAPSADEAPGPAAAPVSNPLVTAGTAGDRMPPPGSLPGVAPAPGRDPAARAEAAAVASPAGTVRPAAVPGPILRTEPGAVPVGEAGARAPATRADPVLPGIADPSPPAGLLPASALAAGVLTGPASAPAQQVAAAVLAELPRGPAGAPAGEGPLKLLTLQLHPADLGTVLVRMRLRDGQLEMTLQASHEDSARLLREGGAVLNDLLRQGGYRPESITVTVGSIPADGRGAPETPGSQQGPGAQGFPGQGESGANQGRPTPDQAGRRSSPDGGPAAPDLPERMHESVSSSPERSGVYL